MSTPINSINRQLKQLDEIICQNSVSKPYSILRIFPWNIDLSILLGILCQYMDIPQSLISLYLGPISGEWQASDYLSPPVQTRAGNLSCWHHSWVTSSRGYSYSSTSTSPTGTPGSSGYPRFTSCLGAILSSTLPCTDTSVTWPLPRRGQWW